MNRLAQRIARDWLRKKTPTQMAVDDLHLLVSDERFERAMGMAAKYMGGRYHNGIIRLPYKFQDKTFPTEFTVLYRKLPCGFITNRDDGNPCVTFDIIPKVGGDPRRSKVYKSFSSTVKDSKTQFGKFLGWLRIVGDAVRKYVSQTQHVRMARSPSPKRVAQRWLDSRTADLQPPLGHPGGTCKVVKRIVDEIESPRLESQLVNEVQRGNSLSNPEAQKVYAPEKERGAWKFKILLTPHAQYRMDLRGITVPEVRAALDQFFRDMNSERSQGDPSLYNKFMSNQTLDYHDKRTNTFFAFVKRNNDVVVITTYKPGDSDPRSDICDVT